jgi:hypothetical protein
MPLGLLDSFALQALSLAALRVLLAVMAEHARQGGARNGELIVPYNQLQRAGLRKSSIKEALETLHALGLVHVKLGTLSHGSVKAPNRFRLTWLGTPDGAMPTDEWDRFASKEEAADHIAAVRRLLLLQRRRDRERRVRMKAQKGSPY